MVGWHHQLDGHEFEHTLGVGDGQGGLACCDSWGRKERKLTFSSPEATAEFSRFVGILMKAQHEGALPPPCIVRKDPRVPHTARRGA